MNDNDERAEVASEALIALSQYMDGVYALAVVSDETGDITVMQVVQGSTREKCPIAEDVLQSIAESVRAVVESKLTPVLLN